MNSILDAIKILGVFVFYGLIFWVIYVNAQFRHLEFTVTTNYNIEAARYTNDYKECVAFNHKHINTKDMVDIYTQNKVKQHSGMNVKINARKAFCIKMFTRKTGKDYYL